MKPPTTAAELVNIALGVNDIYLAAAVFGLANHVQQQTLENVIFAKRRDALTLASWEHTPANVLQALSKSNEAAVQLRLANRHAANKQGMNYKKLINKKTNHSSVTEHALKLVKQAKDSDLSLSSFKTLVFGEDAAVRARVVANMALPAEYLAVFVTDRSVSVRRALATRTDLDVHIMQQLSTDSDDWVRQRLGRNSALSLALMQQLAIDKVNEVRRAITRNKNCPIKLLEQLAKDKCAWVRAGVAYQANTSSHLMRRLATDSDIDVLSGVASNQNTPASILMKLTKHEDADVRRGVILNPKARRLTLKPLLQDAYYLHRILLVSHPKLTPTDKWTLHDDPDFRVRFSVFKWFADSLHRHQMANYVS